MDADVVLL